MYNERISLTPQDILDKEFRIETRGYRPQEVDKYLDLIIRDYTEYNAIIKRQAKDINTLSNENMQLKAEIRHLRSAMEAAESNATGLKNVNNVDLLRRLSQLEKVVFGKND